MSPTKRFAPVPSGTQHTTPFPAPAPAPLEGGREWRDSGARARAPRRVPGIVGARGSGQKQSEYDRQQAGSSVDRFPMGGERNRLLHIGPVSYTHLTLP